MTPIRTSTTNTTLGAGGIPNTDDMPVTVATYGDGTPFMESCWALSWREAWQVLLHRKVYLQVMGRRHPPVHVGVVSDVVPVEPVEQAQP